MAEAKMIPEDVTDGTSSSVPVTAMLQSPAPTSEVRRRPRWLTALRIIAETVLVLAVLALATAILLPSIMGPSSDAQHQPVGARGGGGRGAGARGAGGRSQRN